MPGRQSIDLNAQNMTLFDAFKELTVDRAKNRGTIKVVLDERSKVAELKCSQHHFYSGRVKVSPQDAQQLRDTLSRAITNKMEDASLELFAKKGGKVNDSEGLKKKTKELTDQLGKLICDSFNGDQTLKRADIKQVIVKTEELLARLEKLSIDNLMKCSFKKTEAGEIVLRKNAKPANAKPANAKPKSAKTEAQSAKPSRTETAEQPRKVASLGKFEFKKDNMLDLMSKCDIRKVGNAFLGEIAPKADDTVREKIGAALAKRGIESIAFIDNPFENVHGLRISPGASDEQVKEDFVKLLNALNEDDFRAVCGDPAQLPGPKDFIRAATQERLQAVPRKVLLDELASQGLCRLFFGENADALLQERGITAFSFGRGGKIQLSPSASDVKAQQDFVKLLDLRDDVNAQREEADRKAYELQAPKLMDEYRAAMKSWERKMKFWKEGSEPPPKAPQMPRRSPKIVKSEEVVWTDLFYADFQLKGKQLETVKQTLENAKPPQEKLLKAGDAFLRRISKGWDMMSRDVDSQEAFIDAFKGIFVTCLTLDGEGKLMVGKNASDENIAQDLQLLLDAYMSNTTFRHELSCPPGNIIENVDAFVKDIS